MTASQPRRTGGLPARASSAAITSMHQPLRAGRRRAHLTQMSVDGQKCHAMDDAPPTEDLGVGHHLLRVGAESLHEHVPDELIRISRTFRASTGLDAVTNHHAKPSRMFDGEKYVSDSDVVRALSQGCRCAVSRGLELGKEKPETLLRDRCNQGILVLEVVVRRAWGHARRASGSSQRESLGSVAVDEL